MAVPYTGPHTFPVALPLASVFTDAPISPIEMLEATGGATLLEVRQQVLLLLAQEADSDLASLPTGTTAGATTLTSTSQINRWINEGIALLARTCLPLPARGTKTLVAGENTIRLLTLVYGAQVSRIWACRTVQVGTVTTAHLSRSVVETHYPMWDATGGTPRYWFEDSEGTVSLFPAPDTASPKNMVVSGFAVPVALVADTSALPWLSPDIANLVACYAARQAALKNAEDSEIAPRAGIWAQQWDEGRMLLWQNIDPRTREAHFPTPPGAQAPQGKG